MITFSQFLTESRMAPLYHGTAISALKQIMQYGIKPATVHSNKKLLKKRNIHLDHTRGVSTSRSFKFAKYWGDDVILVLDQQLLSHNYEIKPIQYFATYQVARKQEATGDNFIHANEYEEFIITNKPIPLKYIREVIINSNYKERFESRDIDIPDYIKLTFKD